MFSQVSPKRENLTTLTCVDVHLMIVKVTIMALVVSFLGHQLQADDRTAAGHTG
jgi:hypothetical protein